LLSPQDLCGVDHVESLIKAGISCLKIEGRLKDERYVAATTRAYRNAVDEAWNKILLLTQQQQQPQSEFKLSSTTSSTTTTRAAAAATSTSTSTHSSISIPSRIMDSKEQVSRSELAQIFSRGQDSSNDGLTPGFFEGVRHQQFVIGRSPRHRGIHVGHVGQGTHPKHGIVIIPDDTTTIATILKPGDGIVIDRGMPQEEELGGPVYEVTSHDNVGVGGGTYYIARLARDVERKWKKYDDSMRHRHTSHKDDDQNDPKRSLVPIGAHVWKTSDAQVEKSMKRLVQSDPPRRPVRINILGTIGSPLQIQIIDTSTGSVAMKSSEGLLEMGKNGGLDGNKIRKAIGTLGNSPFAILKDPNGNDMIHSDELEQGAWCPISWVKELRRQAVEQLDLQIQHVVLEKEVKQKIKKDSNASTQAAYHSQTTDNLAQMLVEKSSIHYDDHHKTSDCSSSTTQLSILARSQEQVETICKMVESGSIIHEIIIDFLELDGMKVAVSRVKKTNQILYEKSDGSQKLRCVVASPRIIKPGESGIWQSLLRLNADGLLLRSTGIINRMQKLGGTGAIVHIIDATVADNLSEENDEKIGTNAGLLEVKIPELIGDFSLNAVNTLTIRELLDSGGLSRITLAYDLNANSITKLAKAMGRKGATRLEVIVHAHLPIFHTEHCVFARFLSKGNSYLDCGHVCTRNSVHLRDQNGNDNLVLADMGCRNTVFSAEAQSGVHSIRDWVASGIGMLRVELVDECAEDVRKIVDGYEGVLFKKLRAREVWDTLSTIRDGNGRIGGVSHGSLHNAIERRAGEIDNSY